LTNRNPARGQQNGSSPAPEKAAEELPGDTSARSFAIHGQFLDLASSLSHEIRITDRAVVSGEAAWLRPWAPCNAFAKRMTKPQILPTSGADGAPAASRQLATISETAKDYARNARSENTQRAYESDWRQFSSWLRRQGFDALPPDPQTVGLYLAACAAGKGRMAPMSVPSLERRLSGICWHYRQLGEPLDVSDRHIATVLAGIRRAHGRPPVQKEAIFADDLLAMLATLENDLRGLRDRAILAIGFAGGLRRSEIVGLDCGPDQSDDGTGWIEIFGAGKSARTEKRAETNDDGVGSGAPNDGGLFLGSSQNLPEILR
jgi:hypothetical protein